MLFMSRSLGCDASVVLGYQRFRGALHPEDRGSMDLFKSWYPTTTLQAARTQNTSTWKIAAVKTLKLAFHALHIFFVRGSVPVVHYVSWHTAVCNSLCGVYSVSFLCHVLDVTIRFRLVTWLFREP
jgi:hypothetical protein